MAKKAVSLDSLKQFIRKEASGYLKLPNVTSVGIGYKITGGQPTKELSVQFTVARKVAPEALDTIGATELPKSVVVDGVEVPTDVLQRSFEKSANEVKLASRIEAASARKSAINPIVPGVSIGHPRISAGTAGCVVYDANTATPYVLSNWHVLHGTGGQIGDQIVQPGKHDDNRIDRNVAGKLIRSHLGLAGDYAIATIDNRALTPDILDLGVAVARIGEPELGDRVVKSGRTTDVTYGLVNRVHTIANIDYGPGVGVQEIGCFEIGPDADHPAANDEISMGGDSGAAWLLVERNNPKDMMLGLHFAGEVDDEPDHALACYAASVFEKLGVLPARPAIPSPAVIEATSLGYRVNFLGAGVHAPRPAGTTVQGDLLEVNGRTVFDYMHFSLAMSKSRRFARWVAWNIDGGSLRRLSRNGIPFKKDPNLPADAQVGNELYANNPLDRGHLARRADLLWGSLAEAKRANVDSFFYTNITPQHEEFNQSSAGGIWGRLEDALFAEVDVEDLRVAVMAGPVLAASDPVYRGVALPKKFWKVLYYREAGEDAVRAKAYVLSQEDLLSELESLELPEFTVFEVPLARVSDLTGLTLFGGDGTEVIRPRRGRARPAAVEAAGKPRRVSRVEEIIRAGGSFE